MSLENLNKSQKKENEFEKDCSRCGEVKERRRGI